METNQPQDAAPVRGMDVKTIVKWGAIALFVLFLIFGSMSWSNKLILCLGAVMLYQTVKRTMAQGALKDAAKDGMAQVIAESGVKPDYQHFFADGNQVSGVAISKDDPRIVLASSGVPAKLFDRRDVLSVSSYEGNEKDIKFKAIAATGARDREVDKKVFVVDVNLRDLDHPRYKLYFETADLMRQWDTRLSAWMEMHKTGEAQ